MLLTAMSGSEILQAIIQILTAGLQSMATALGSAVNAFATNIFFTDSTMSALSVVAILTCCFGGIGLAIGLGRRILTWVTSFGR